MIRTPGVITMDTIMEKVMSADTVMEKNMSADTIMEKAMSADTIMVKSLTADIFSADLWWQLQHMPPEQNIRVLPDYCVP